MNYSPRGFYVWDCWYMPKGTELHAFHLQVPRADLLQPGGSPWPSREPFGHAVTNDLIHWHTEPGILAPNASLVDDDIQHWTGCALWHEHKAYLFYTMRAFASSACLQKIGLATSVDALKWELYPNNPVLVPDPKWYATPDFPVRGILDCRDFHVIPAPQGGWLGYFATRQPGSELPETSVIGCAYSTDLFNWKQLPPAFAPRKYACVEVPDVFPLNGRWYLICLTGNRYGNRGIFEDPNHTSGTIYAVADRPEGPFHELEDNILLAGGPTSPFAARTVAFLGDLFFMYTDRERVGRIETGIITDGTITTPKLLRTSGDSLVVKYSSLIEKCCEGELFSSGHPLTLSEIAWGQIWSMPVGRWIFEDQISGQYDTGWTVQSLNCQAKAFIFEAKVQLHSAIAAGITLRMKGDRPGTMQGLVIMLDAREQHVALSDIPAFHFQETRRTPIHRNHSYHLRVVQRLEHIEVYLDDILLLALSHYQDIGGGLGLFVDRGSAVFSKVKVRKLTVNPPED